ncbi:MAG: hypothetical protein K6F35_02890 [Lachnospiraceae bacterium]|nr:hypothetical protein [Lachnospiraceae bacterium]
MIDKASRRGVKSRAGKRILSWKTMRIVFGKNGDTGGCFWEGILGEGGKNHGWYGIIFCGKMKRVQSGGLHAKENRYS